MYETNNLLLNEEKIFNALLLLYPEQYRKKYGNEMRLIFQDLYHEEIERKGKIGLRFWFNQVEDIAKSVIKEHINLISKKGMKKYLEKTFHLNKFNVIGGILLLPFIFLFGVDFLGRIVQGDFTHYNRAWYSAISHTILYVNYNGQAPLLWAILIFAPILAVVLNFIPIINSLRKNKKLTIINLSFANPLAIIIMGMGFFCLLVVLGHDIFPCVVNGLTKGGFENFFNVLSVCRNA